MFKIKFIIFLIVLATACNGVTYAQKPQAVATLEKDTILVGQQPFLFLSCTYPLKAEINWPVFKDTIIKDIEIISISKFDTVSLNNNFITLSQKIKITSFDSGSYTIPPFKFSYFFKNDTSINEIETLPLKLVVNLIPVDTTLSIKDIKKPLDSPLTWREVFPWIIGIFILIAVSIIVIYIVKRIRKKKPLIGFTNKKYLEPHEQALKELEELKAQKLWEKGKVKEYYSILTDIIRTYISKRFDIKATEMTSNEILNTLNNIFLHEECINKLQQILFWADMAKFAKAQPLVDENITSMEYAIEFVNATKPVIIDNVQNNNKIETNNAT
jgi:hypothetical protein